MLLHALFKTSGVAPPSSDRKNVMNELRSFDGGVALPFGLNFLNVALVKAQNCCSLMLRFMSEPTQKR